jgi:3-hydroxyacyl-CoA dehydrogenase
MGRAIAAHLANAGMEVLLLDIVPKDAPSPGAAGAHEARSRLAIDALKALPKDRPAPLFSAEIASRIHPGNLEDDLSQLSAMDWVVEVVIERADIKGQLFERIAAHLGPKTILSSNTSGIPIAELSKTLPAELRPRFLGTHFFNPPRYMHLLELIAGPETLPAVMAQMKETAEGSLGKGVVVANDRPNFIANRIGAHGMLRTVQLAMDGEYSVEDVEAVTGPLVGRPKSATFRTADLVGLDVLLHVAANVRNGAADDPEIDAFTPHPILTKMVEAGMLGSKTDQGFFKKRKTEDGKSVIDTIDLKTLEYRETIRPRFPELEPLKQTEELIPRLRALMKSKGRGAELAWAILRDSLRYAASVADEIADDIAAIDRAMCWGFGWKMGPFEVWQGLGIARVCERIEKEGHPAPAWVLEHVKNGADAFYLRDEEGTACTLALSGDGRARLVARPGILQLVADDHGPRELARNAGASVWDLGDNVLGLEFHSKMNSLGGDSFAMGQKAMQLAEESFDAIVVGNQGEHFSAGANVALLLFAALEGEWEDIDLMVRSFQRMTMGFRQCSKPVVVAPFSLTLGGGAEVTLHGDEVCASAELYMGLVEVGVGLIPAGGGTKEMYLRMLDAEGPEGDPRNAAKRAFELIGMGKVSTSAQEAKNLGLLRPSDAIQLNADRLLSSAKARALALARSGYRAPAPRNEIPVGGDDTYALLEVGLYNFLQAGQISEHDRLIGLKIAQILSGGAHRSGPSPKTVSEQDLLDLEREAFLSLCGQRKSLERIQHMLKRGKPLRN